jgi:ribose transport system ATP-binding protein
VDTSLALHVDKVSKRYGPTQALTQASLAVEKGEVHALIGENGAGKSTLVKILSGIVSPDEGIISVAGRPIGLSSSRDALAAGLATAFQELSLVRELTVAQNMMLGREPRGRLGLVSNDAMAQATLRLFDEWELEGVDPDAELGDLSLAVRQQLELVRTLSRGSAVLLLDEPTAALGAVQVEWLFRQIARVRERGGTILFISHRMSEVREICDRVTVLRGGRSVSTFATDSATDDEVVEMMLGRAVEQVVAYEGPAPEVGGPVLTVTHLSSEPALRDASFTLHSGEVLGVAALQGHGQFDLFMTLFGARRRSGGTIELNGRKIRLKSPHQAIKQGLGISLVPEDRKAEGVMLDMSGLANMTLPSIGRFSRFGFLNKRAERAEATRVFGSLNVKLGALDDDVSALSGGNQQKIAIGKWMLADNHVLLLYDPTRGVDIGTKTEIFQMMRAMAREGRSILFYSTDIEELLGVSHRVLVLYRGKVVSELSGDACTRNAVLGAMLGSGSIPRADGPSGEASIQEATP